MFDHLKVGTRLALGFGFILTLLVALWGINYAALSHMAKLEDKMFDVIDKTEENALRVHIAVLELRRNEKDIFINVGTPSVEKYAVEWRANHQHLTDLFAEQENLLSRGEQDKAALQTMKTDLADYAKGFLAVLAKIQGGEIKSTQEANAAVAPFKDATHRLMKNAQAMATELSKQSGKEMERLDQLQTQVTLGVTAVALAALLAGIVFAVAIQRSIVRPLNELKAVLDNVGQTGDLTVRADARGTSEFADMAAHLNRTLQAMNDSMRAVTNQAASVAATAVQLACAGTQLKQSSRDQAESTAAMAAAVEESASSISAVAQRAKDTETIANEAASYVDQGRSVVHEAGDEMALTATKVAESSAQISDLSEKSRQISGIVGVIREIAEQTNLLALNAAIEAARAGETGRGFAVVSDEVRKLAERTAAATTEIRNLIEAVQQVTEEAVGSMKASSAQTDKGVLLAGKAGESFLRINEGTQRTVGNIQDITAAAQEQKTAVEHIARNVEKVAAMAEQNDASTDQLLDSAMQLRELANSMLGAAQRFRTA